MSDELKAQAREFINANPMGHVASVAGEQPYSRVMQTARIDEDFTIYYAAFAWSSLIAQAHANPRVCITYYYEGEDVRVFGRAKLLIDADLRKELWQDIWEKYWPRRAEDPDYVIVRVTPERVEYRNFATGGTGYQRVI